MSKLLMRVEDAANELSLGRSKTYALLRTGELPSVKIGRSVRIVRSALEQFVNEKAAAAQGDGSDEELADASTGGRAKRRRP